MKVGLAVIGAIIQDENMLYQAIKSVESLTDWNEKVILMDGLPETGSPTQADNYAQMLDDGYWIIMNVITGLFVRMM